MSRKPPPNPPSSRCPTAPIDIPRPRNQAPERPTHLELFLQNPEAGMHVQALRLSLGNERDPRLVEQAVQNAHDWRVRRYYGDQELVPGGSVVPRPSAEDVARRERTSGIRSPISYVWRKDAMGHWFEVEGLNDVTHTITSPAPEIVNEKEKEKKVKEGNAKQKRPDTMPDSDPNWTKDEIVDDDEIPDAEIPDMPLEEEDDPGKEFEIVGEEATDDFEVIEGFAVNGAAPNSRNGRRNALRYLRGASG